MKAHSTEYRRRTFLRWSLSLTAGVPFALAGTRDLLAEAAGIALPSVAPPAGGGAQGRVAIVPCVSYGAEVDSALRKSFDLLGGIGSL